MTHLQECLNVELFIGKKICNLMLMYRSPSQIQEGPYTFLDNLESNLETESLFDTFLKILIGDFSAKRDSWSSKDSSTR